MGTTIVIESPAAPEAVLAAIRDDAREWRESVIPEPLRAELRYRVGARVKGGRFRLTLPAYLEQAENVTLHGVVSPAPGGGSVVRAGFRSSSPLFWLLMAGVGALTMAANVPWGLSLVAVGVLLAAFDEARGSRMTEEDSATAAYLAERLRGAVGAAAALGAGAETMAYDPIDRLPGMERPRRPETPR